MDYYTARALARASGVSRNLLATWNRIGYLKPLERSRGSRAEFGYSKEQALGVCALGRMRGELGDRALGRVAAMLPGSIPESGFLIIDARMVAVAANADELAARIVEPARRTWTFDIRALAEALENA